MFLFPPGCFDRSQWLKQTCTAHNQINNGWVPYSRLGQAITHLRVAQSRRYSPTPDFPACQNVRGSVKHAAIHSISLAINHDGEAIALWLYLRVSMWFMDILIFLNFFFVVVHSGVRFYISMIWLNHCATSNLSLGISLIYQWFDRI